MTPPPTPRTLTRASRNGASSTSLRAPAQTARTGPTIAPLALVAALVAVVSLLVGLVGSDRWVDAAGAGVASVVPARVLETRDGPGLTTVDHEFEGIGRRTAGTTLELTVAGRGGVPSDADAVMLNVTAVNPGAAGFLTVFPCGATQPVTSNVNYGPGSVVPNAVLAKIGTGGKICIFTLADTHILVDINGYVPGSASTSTTSTTTTTATTTSTTVPVVDDAWLGFSTDFTDDNPTVRLSADGRVFLQSYDESGVYPSPYRVVNPRTGEVLHEPPPAIEGLTPWALSSNGSEALVLDADTGQATRWVLATGTVMDVEICDLESVPAWADKTSLPLPGASACVLTADEVVTGVGFGPQWTNASRSGRYLIKSLGMSYAVVDLTTDATVTAIPASVDGLSVSDSGDLLGVVHDFGTGVDSYYILPVGSASPAEWLPIVYGDPADVGLFAGLIDADGQGMVGLVYDKSAFDTGTLNHYGTDGSITPIEYDVPVRPAGCAFSAIHDSRTAVVFPKGPC